jgi:hypothetical protein
MAEPKSAQAPADVEATELTLKPGTLAALSRSAVVTPPPTPDTTQPGATVPTSADWQAKFAEETHQYIREYIRNADQKAGFFFTAAAALLAFLHSKGTSTRWLKPLISWSLIDTLAFLTMAGLATGAVFLMFVVLPRLTGSKRGILFFNAIAEFESSREYGDDIASKTLSEVVRTKLQHIWQLSRICRQKYWCLQWGCWIAGGGAISGLLYFLLSRGPTVPGAP